MLTAEPGSETANGRKDQPRGEIATLSLVRRGSVQLELTMFRFILITAFVSVMIWVFSRKR
jgi:hypothetical protein